MDNVEAKLDQLEEDGFITVENALTPAETEHVRQRINHARSDGLGRGAERRRQYVVRFAPGP